MTVTEMDLIEIDYDLPIQITALTVSALRWALKTHHTLLVL